MMVSFVLCVVAWNGPVRAQDTLGNRMVAAERYIDTFDLKKMMEASTTEIAKNLPIEKRESLIRYMSGELYQQRLRNFSINSMAEIFTLEELNAMAEFYGSPVGKSALKKMPRYMGLLGPFLLQESRRVVEALR